MQTSIVVSMYNKTDNTIEAIDKMFLPSLFRNGSKNKEVIIVDDCSPLEQKTKEMIKRHISSLKKRFGRVIFSRNQENLGFGGSYNRALSLATGKNIVITNDDVYFPLGSIDSLVKLLKIHDKVGAIGPITGWRGVSTLQYCRQGPKILSYSSNEFEKIETFATKIAKIMRK